MMRRGVKRKGWPMVETKGCLMRVVVEGEHYPSWRSQRVGQESSL